MCMTKKNYQFCTGNVCRLKVTFTSTNGENCVIIIIKLQGINSWNSIYSVLCKPCCMHYQNMPHAWVIIQFGTSSTITIGEAVQIHSAFRFQPILQYIKQLAVCNVYFAGSPTANFDIPSSAELSPLSLGSPSALVSGKSSASEASAGEYIYFSPYVREHDGSACQYSII